MHKTPEEHLAETQALLARSEATLRGLAFARVSLMATIAAYEDYLRLAAALALMEDENRE